MPTLKARKAAAKFPEHALVYWEDWDYTLFQNIIIRNKSNKAKTTYADLIIMADTETSKKKDHVKKDNHICAWSISFRAFGRNLVTLWGQKPTDFPEMLSRVRDNIKSDELYVYWFNMGYDWVFIRKFMFLKFGFPCDALNTKPLCPLSIKWDNGIIFKDSLALAQRSLEKWANDLDCEHKKAVGKWDYDKFRNQDDKLSDDELLYICNDVLAGVEAIDITMAQLKKTLSSIPLTATGIVRNEARNIGRHNRAHNNWFLKVQPAEYIIQQILEYCFHGGYTHSNRYCIDNIWECMCYDFSSSYPFVLLTEKYPAEQFTPIKRKVTPEMILKPCNENYAFIFLMKVKNVRLKNPKYPMPMLSLAKCLTCLNSVTDNGRILESDYIEIYTNEIDFRLFYDQYDYDEIEIDECYSAVKDYLPKWFTDYVFERYRLKCELKHTDPVLYAIEKAKLNSCFGMCAQKPVKETIEEIYEECDIGEGLDKQHYKSGDYRIKDDFDPEKEYQKFLNRYSSFLPYPVGVWCTSYAMKNLFELSKCISGKWLYSDTDSIYATEFDESLINKYNNKCKEKLKSRGYDGVTVDGETFYLGVAEDDGHYMQAKFLHSKCYVKRPLTARGDNFVMGGDLKITVAGVPKKGAKSLKNNINNFKTYAVFPGTESGKLQHSHIYVDKIYVDNMGNITGDSIDLSPCDYIIGDAKIPRLEDYLTESVEVIDYEQIELWDLL